jgi:hypothetical protein
MLGMDTIIAALGVLGGIVAFSVGLWQYRNAQRWKVLEFVAKEIKEFEQYPAVSNAMMMLDYEGMEIELFPERKEAKQRVVEVREPLIVSSLIVKQQRDFTDRELVIRDTFDEFFGYLERFDQYVETGLVAYKDFHPYLRYWLGILAEARSGLKTEKLVIAVREFLTAFEYSGVLRLLDRYRKLEAANSASR